MTASARRLLPLPCRSLAGRWRVAVAVTWRARLLGLAGLRGVEPRTALLLPACRSVHTIGMRFALDLVWVDDAGAVVRVDAGVGPWRVRSCRRATAVVETPAGCGAALARAWAAARGEHHAERDRGGGHDGQQCQRRDDHRGDDQRDDGQRRERGGREVGVLVGHEHVIGQPLGPVALPAARALASTGPDGTGAPAVRALTDRGLTRLGHQEGV
jgi:uncharacterized membrane protein (UPF0127 family)